MSTNANICQRLRTLSESLGADAEICEYAAARIEELERQLAEANALLDKVKRVTAIAEKANDEASEMELACSATLTEAMAYDLLEATEKQLADAKADSERLDWLETNLRFLEHERSTCSVDMSGNAVRLQYNQRATKLIRAATVRAAIDAARKKQP